MKQEIAKLGPISDAIKGMAKELQRRPRIPAFILYAPRKVSKYHGPFYTVTEAELYAESKLQYKPKEYEVHLLVQP